MITAAVAALLLQLAPPAAATSTCTIYAVPDGDTITCNERISDYGRRIQVRLTLIDAPEMGTCQTGRICAPGDPIASRANLAWLAGAKTKYEWIDANRCKSGFQREDYFGRRIGRVYNLSGVDLNQAQLDGSFAIPLDYRCENGVMVWDNYTPPQ